MGVLESIKVK